MTKIINLLGKQEKEKGKPIEFEECFNEDENKFVKNTNIKPEDFKYLTFLYTWGGYDYMFVWNEEEGGEYICRGQLNDGFVKEEDE